MDPDVMQAAETLSEKAAEVIQPEEKKRPEQLTTERSVKVPVKGLSDIDQAAKSISDKSQGILDQPEPRSFHVPPAQHMPNAQPQIKELQAFAQQEAQALKQHEAHIARVDAETPWKQLREDDPAEFAALRAELQEAKSTLAQRRQALEEGVKGVVESHDQMQQAQMMQHVEEQRQSLYRAVPELKSEKERYRLGEYLRNEGFSPEEIASASDHRILAVAYKAMVREQGGVKKRGIRIASRKSADAVDENGLTAQMRRQNIPSGSIEAAAMKIGRKLKSAR